MFKALVLLAVGAFGRISYEGQQILRCRYEEGAQIHRLEEAFVDVQGVLPNNIVDVRVQRPSDMENIKRELTDCQVMVANLEELTKKVEEENENALRDDPTWFSAYRSYADIQSWLQKYANENPGLVKYLTLGRSTSGGRQISGVSVYGGTGTPRYRAWHTGGIHAREWVAPTTVMYIFDQLVSRYKDRSDANLTTYVNNVETFFFPSINPDGYEYSRSNDRQWRKNRRANSGVGACVGVDCNRNFPDHWGQGGSSNQTCSDTYMGPSARSENETIAVSEYFANVAATSRIILAIDWHSYSQLFLRPYGWTNSVSPDETRFATLGTAYVNEVYKYQQKNYTSQRSYQLYQTTGSASDWYYGASNTKNNTQRTASWTVELRPSSSESSVGFVLPPAQISPTGQENWNALKQLQWSIYSTPLP